MKPATTYYSECCLASVRLYSGDEGTNHYICNTCNEACDITTSSSLLLVLSKQLLTAYYNGLDKNGWSRHDEDTSVAAILVAIKTYITVNRPDKKTIDTEHDYDQNTFNKGYNQALKDYQAKLQEGLQ